MLTCDSTTAMDRAILMAPTLATTLLPPTTVRVAYLDFIQRSSCQTHRNAPMAAWDREVLEDGNPC
jgi:hypothetical protein